MPKGEILNVTDNKNRLLWFIEYATISVEGIACALQSSQVCKYQFWQFEYMLHRVMDQEKNSGRLSSIRHIIDMTGYEINPFTMVFISSGTLAYYSQLFHYENYPELVTPIDMVNIAKWIHVPYKLAKAMMPAGFTDRFRLHDGNFLKELTEDISIEHIPTTLGGKQDSIVCIGAGKPPSQMVPPTLPHEIHGHMECFHIPARGRRQIVAEVTEPTTLSWYFRTDGDIFFGVFFEAQSTPVNNHPNFDLMEMVYPWLKLTARQVHERDSIKCERVGRYVWPSNYVIIVVLLPCR
ncbi:unnamed protein product [Cylicostephanus goldi]|uniref:CRAL-TRIO domain-containing protein n=1 Tax=Cylicostephanus goldi TaxID=71465 RepID=A0A3P6RA45_CYLGO|nr:unnamed protein product [Cylicostephanus goldi]